MRKLALLLALVVVFTISAVAQTGASSQGTTGSTDTSTTTKTTKKTKTTKTEDSSGTASAKASQVTGCLAKDASGSGYMLTNGRYKKGVEVKSSEDLSAHVGHEVKLMGAWEKPTSGEAGGAGAKGHEMRTFNATKVNHIADTCTAGAAKGKKAKSETSKAPGF